MISRIKKINCCYYCRSWEQGLRIRHSNSFHQSLFAGRKESHYYFNSTRIFCLFVLFSSILSGFEFRRLKIHASSLASETLKWKPVQILQNKFFIPQKQQLVVIPEMKVISSAGYFKKIKQISLSCFL